MKTQRILLTAIVLMLFLAFGVFFACGDDDDDDNDDNDDNDDMADDDGGVSTCNDICEDIDACGYMNVVLQYVEDCYDWCLGITIENRSCFLDADDCAAIYACLEEIFDYDPPLDDDDDDTTSGTPMDPEDCDDFCTADTAELAMECEVAEGDTVGEVIEKCMERCESGDMWQEELVCWDEFTDCDTLNECIDDVYGL